MPEGDPVKPVLAICSLKWQHQCVAALADLMKYNFFIGNIFIEGSLLPFARNEAIRFLLDKHPDFTHLVFIDDDMGSFTIQQIDQLIQADKPVISAFMTHRLPPYKLVCTLPEERQSDNDIIDLIEKNAIVETALVGMAFTVIRRDVLDKVGEETPDGGLWFTMDRSPRESFKQDFEDFVQQVMGHFENGQLKKDQFQRFLLEAISLGQSSHLGSKLIGEDIAFSRRLDLFGIKKYVHCGCVIDHIGSIPINVSDTLKYRREEAIREAKGVEYPDRRLTIVTP